jgi:flavodoxin
MKVLVVYYSMTGHVQRPAGAVAAGASGVGG